MGIHDAGLSERLQLNAKLDLATAIAQVRQHEDVKKQQTVLRSSDSSAHMDAVMHNKYKKNNYKQKTYQRHAQASDQSTSTQVKPCGKSFMERVPSKGC